MRRKKLPINRPDWIGEVAKAILNKQPIPVNYFLRKNRNNEDTPGCYIIDTPYERVKFCPSYDPREMWYCAYFAADDGWIGVIEYWANKKEWRWYLEDDYYFPDSRQSYNRWAVDYKKRVLEDIAKGESDNILYAGKWNAAYLSGVIIDDLATLDVRYEPLDGSCCLHRKLEIGSLDEFFSPARRFFYMKDNLVYWPYETRWALKKMFHYQQEQHRRFMDMQILDVGGLNAEPAMHFKAKVKIFDVYLNVTRDKININEIKKYSRFLRYWKLPETEEV